MTSLRVTVHICQPSNTLITEALTKCTLIEVIINYNHVLIFQCPGVYPGASRQCVAGGP